MIGLKLNAKESKKIRFLMGYAQNKEKSINIINQYLKPLGEYKPGLKLERDKKHPLIGHGQIPNGTPQPYSEYSKDGNKLLIHTPYTTRPYDHAMANQKGHFVVVTNRGLHTTSNGNSQQNRITPDCPDTVTREVPGEAFYLYDYDNKEWFSPAVWL